jgi:hypothetical protein
MLQIRTKKDPVKSTYTLKCGVYSPPVAVFIAVKILYFLHPESTVFITRIGTVVSDLCLLPKIAAAAVPTLRTLKSTFRPITLPFAQAGDHKIVFSSLRQCTA